MPCLYQVWQKDAFWPEPIESLSKELPLDRVLFGVRDGEISGTGNAPRISPIGNTAVQLRVPAASRFPVLVIEDAELSSLQEHVPPPEDAWKISPAQLSDPSRLVLAPNASLLFAQHLHWKGPGPRHHLLLLPKGRYVDQGFEDSISMPALLVVGPCAVQVMQDTTQGPAPRTRPPAGAYSVEIPSYQYHTGLAPALDRLESHQPTGYIVAPYFRTELPVSDLPLVCAEILRAEGKHSCFFPVLDDGHLPRLVFAYQRADRSIGFLLSDHEIREWLRDLGKTLNSRTAPTLPPRVQPGNLPAAQLTTFGSLRTRNRGFAKVLGDLQAVGPSEVDVLLLGETGTGKEHVARAIHDSSARKNGPFVAVNCGGTTEELIASELFGHVKGSFTGAAGSRKGRFQEAEGGTLLLDEIGDAPIKFQVSLLRALEDRRVLPVGADREVAVNVRVIAATSQPLEELVERDVFRKDLYYRLAGSQYTLPPLRRRMEDLPDLCTTILASIDPGASLAPDARELLETYAWPGNVRELKNALTAAVFKARAEEGSGAGEALALRSKHFEFAAHSTAWLSPVSRPLHAYSDEVRQIAAHIWQEQALPTLIDRSPARRRATLRAALLYLDSQYAESMWPPVLQSGWERLFGDRWHTTERGRGMRELMGVLSVDLGDGDAVERVKEWVLGRVGERRGAE